MGSLSRTRWQILGSAYLIAVILASAERSALATDYADRIYTHARVETIDSNMSKAQAIAIEGTKILGVGSTQSILREFRGPNTQVTRLKGATVLPGFIDSHSHTFGWGLFTDTDHWIDLSSVNVLLKPPPNDLRCPNPKDYQNCFIPVQTQDDVIARIKAALRWNDRSASVIRGFNYDPARLGHSKDCVAGGLGFECPNFENGTPRATLDRISTTHPILITSESGHIVYVNTPYLRKLNICGTDVAGGNCLNPVTNSAQESVLANLGQLNEDLALFAQGATAGELFEQNPLLAPLLLGRAARAYQQHGFTLVQEGAAPGSLIDIYELVTQLPDFPVTAAIFVNDPTSVSVADAIQQAKAAQTRIKDNPNMFIAAIKVLADGSNQGYTGFMKNPYYQYFFPFTDSALYFQPYAGLPDLNTTDIAAAATMAHQAGFPLAIHQNGDASISSALRALKQAGTVQGLKDFLIHFTLATAQDIADAISLEASATFLMPNAYYYGLMMCQQILGAERTRALYPAASAASAGLRFGLHSDSPVTPPYPLFLIWTAKTRKAQQPSWYPNKDQDSCPVLMSPEESISIAQGIKAFTIDAAWAYGLENELGSIEPGKTADLVILSANPLQMEHSPDRLKTVRVLATVHHGKQFDNPKANEAPIWPE